MGIVTAVCGVVTALATVAIIRGWSAGPWMERLLLVCIVTLVAAAGWIVIALAIAASLRIVAFLFAPDQPPGLNRINAIIEQRQAEQHAAAAARQAREPPPAEIVVALRAITGHGHP